MKDFWKVLKRYVAPYKRYLCGSLVFNILAAVLNVFSFTMLMPILQILFKVNEQQYSFIEWHWPMGFNELSNNLYYFVNVLIQQSSASRVLLMMCLIFSAITLLKTSFYFLSAAVMIPLRTGVVKDLRMQIYNKIVSLPIGFFSQERKGDIIARMSGDVQEVETLITSTLDMLIKNPSS